MVLILWLIVNFGMKVMLMLDLMKLVSIVIELVCSFGFSLMCFSWVVIIVSWFMLVLLWINVSDLLCSVCIGIVLWCLVRVWLVGMIRLRGWWVLMCMFNLLFLIGV